MGFAEGTFGLVECAAFCGPEDANFVGEDEGIDEDGIGLGVDDAAILNSKSDGAESRS